MADSAARGDGSVARGVSRRRPACHLGAAPRTWRPGSAGCTPRERGAWRLPAICTTGGRTVTGTGEYSPVARPGNGRSPEPAGRPREERVTAPTRRAFSPWECVRSRRCLHGEKRGRTLCRPHEIRPPTRPVEAEDQELVPHGGIRREAQAPCRRRARSAFPGIASGGKPRPRAGGRARRRLIRAVRTVAARGRTCGPCRRSGPAWCGTPSPASGYGHRPRRSAPRAAARRP